MVKIFIPLTLQVTGGGSQNPPSTKMLVLRVLGVWGCPNFLTIPLYQYTRGWYRFRTRQGPPWSTEASFLERGLDFRIQKSEFSDISRGFRGQNGLGHVSRYKSESYGSFPTTFRLCFHHFQLSHNFPPFA